MTVHSIERGSPARRAGLLSRGNAFENGQRCALLRCRGRVGPDRRRTIWKRMYILR
ncbi:unnamed protein product [Ectocarpus sp. 12 AP-2014]